MRSTRVTATLARFIRRIVGPVESPPSVRHASLPSLTRCVLTEIKRSPPSVASAFLICASELETALGPAFEDLVRSELEHVFCSMVAHALKPYGDGCAGTALEDLLRAKTLDCSTYGLLTVYLARLCGESSEAPPTVHFVGWDGGAIGNHQMLLMKCRSRMSDVILDPTVGVTARGSFDALAAGRPIARADIVAVSEREPLQASRQSVGAALMDGAFRPSDLLYYFESMEHYLHRYGHPSEWPTPGAVAWRARACDG